MQLIVKTLSINADTKKHYLSAVLYTKGRSATLEQIIVVILQILILLGIGCIFLLSNSNELLRRKKSHTESIEYQYRDPMNGERYLDYWEKAESNQKK